MHGIEGRMTFVAALSIALVVVAAGTLSAQQQEQAEPEKADIGETEFGWVSVDEEAGTVAYKWQADVVNKQPEEQKLAVVLELLDAEENVAYEETVEVLVPAEESQQVEQEGTVRVEVAAQVTAYRYRLQALN